MDPASRGLLLRARARLHHVSSAAAQSPKRVCPLRKKATALDARKRQESVSVNSVKSQDAASKPLALSIEAGDQVRSALTLGC